MNFLIIFLVFLLNAGGIGLIYLLVKDKTQMQRIIYIAASFTIMYLISMLVYVLGSIGVPDVNNSYYRTYIVLLIAPINLLATVPLLIKSYKDMKKKEISFNKFSNIVTVSIVVLLVLCVCEVFAIKIFLKNNSSEAKSREVVIYENNNVSMRDLLANDLVNGQSSNTSTNTNANNTSLNSQEANILTNETNSSLNTNVENSESNTLSNSLNLEDSSSSSSISSNNESVVSNIETNPNGIGILVN